MTDDLDIRDALDSHLSVEPPMRLDLDTTLQLARRSRGRRRLATTAAGSLGVVAAISGGLALAGGRDVTPAPAPASAPSPAAVSYPGPVPALIESRVRADIPGGADLIRRTIYPSDWNRSTALPYSQTANATDWHGAFGIPGQPAHELWIGVFISPAGTNPTETELARQCAQGVPQCTYRKLADGSLLLTQISGSDSRGWTRTVLHFRTGDRGVNVREKIHGMTLAEAQRAWIYTPEQLARLATDAAVAIPEPAVTPPLPPR